MALACLILKDAGEPKSCVYHLCVVLIERDPMDFNSLLRLHLEGGENRILMPAQGIHPPTGEYIRNWDPSALVLGGTIEGAAPADARSEASQVKDQYSQRLLDMVFEPPFDEGANGGHHLPQSPPLTTTPPIPAVSQTAQSTTDRLDMLRSLQEHLMNSYWVLGNLPEPPTEPSDPLVIAGLLKPWHSRFDAFLGSSSSRHTCQFFLWETMRCCPETNYRRDRLRVHLLAHFSYVPYPCGGKCGRSNCVLAFAENGLLIEHVQRSLRPRVQCEFCDLEISQQNYRRHLTVKHSDVAGK